MITVFDTPVGLDVQIRKLQEKLHPRLMELWGMDKDDPEQNKLFQSYPRCYRNKKNQGYIAELYIGKNEYKEVYWDAKYNVVSFFGVGDIVKHGSATDIADVHLVYFVDLNRIKPGILHRADEEARLDVINLIGKYSFNFKYTGYETGINNVLREYPGSYRDNRLNAVDMHPVHCFRLNFSLSYNRNNCYP